MPRRIIKRFIPDQETIRSHKHLKFLGTLLHDPYILHLNRRSVSGAFAVGLFTTFVPIPFQMGLAAVGAIMFRVNLPISVLLVWITNPLTMGPIYFFTYKVGTWVLGKPVRVIEFEISVNWLMQELGTIWQPFLLGCFIVGAISAILGYVSIRLLWRLYVSRSWRKRQFERSQNIER